MPTPSSYTRVEPLTLECASADCKVRMRISRILNPSPRVGAFEFCPVCGSRAFAVHDTEESYWESLSKTYGPPPEVMKQVYDAWNPHEHYRFSDFFNELMAELASESPAPSKEESSRD